MWFWFHIEFCIGKPIENPSTFLFLSLVFSLKGEKKNAQEQLYSYTCTAFIVACLVSFRALFSQNERPSQTGGRRARRKQPPGSGSGPTPQYQSGGSTTIVGSSGNASRGTLNNVLQKSRFKLFQDSVLDTCRTLEGLGDDDESMIEMDPLATVDHTRPDVGAELGTIGGFQNMGEGTGQTVPIRSSHDSLENLNQDAAERDSQGVSVLDEEDYDRDAGFGKRDVPRRRDTVLSHTSQLSVDSLYMGRSDDRSERPSASMHGGG